MENIREFHDSQTGLPIAINRKYIVAVRECPGENGAIHTRINTSDEDFFYVNEEYKYVRNWFMDSYGQTP